MLHWSDLHPYNAIHVARIAEAPDPQRLRRTIEANLQRRGLAGIEIDRRRNTFLYVGEACDCAIEILPAGADPLRELVGIIRQQLNTSFACSGRFCPIRFFALPVDEGFWLGLVYFHPVADAVSIVDLLNELVGDYLGGDTVADTPPPNLYPPRFDNLLRHRPGVLARKIIDLPAGIFRARRSIRPRYENPEDMTAGFRLLTLPAGQLDGLLRTSKAWQVTLNDLFLALLLKALAGIAGARAKKGRRSMSIGCIVNLRHDHGMKGELEFGLFLGSFSVTQEVSPDTELKSLAQAVCRQTRRSKRLRLPLGLPLDLAIGRLTLRLLSLERQRKFYQKNRPLWGGITNMNLNSIPSRPDGARPADYLRAVGTGPATPLVLSITTFGKTAHIGISYRTTVFGEPSADEFQSNFADEMAGCVLS